MTIRKWTVSSLASPLQLLVPWILFIDLCHAVLSYKEFMSHGIACFIDLRNVFFIKSTSFIWKHFEDQNLLGQNNFLTRSSSQKELKESDSILPLGLPFCSGTCWWGVVAEIWMQIEKGEALPLWSVAHFNRGLFIPLVGKPCEAAMVTPSSEWSYRFTSLQLNWKNKGQPMFKASNAKKS